MKRLRMLRRILRNTGADKIMLGFVIFVLVCAFLIWLREPDIKTYGDAFWYCFAALTTIGFGDVVVHTLFSRTVTVVLSIYAAAVLAIFTAVVVNFFQQVISQGHREELQAFFEKLEHLPELSREELAELSRQAHEWRK